MSKEIVIYENGIFTVTSKPDFDTPNFSILRLYAGRIDLAQSYITNDATLEDELKLAKAMLRGWLIDAERSV